MTIKEAMELYTETKNKIDVLRRLRADLDLASVASHGREDIRLLVRGKAIAPLRDAIRSKIYECEKILQEEFNEDFEESV